MAGRVDRVVTWGRQAVPGPGVPGLAAGAALGAIGGSRTQLQRMFQHRYPTVAVTGMTGVGKTVLVDHLCRRTSSPGPVESGSAVMEYRVRRGGDLRGLAGAANLAVDVLPASSLTREGSVSAEQRDAYLAALESRMAQFAGHV